MRIRSLPLALLVGALVSAVDDTADADDKRVEAVLCKRLENKKPVEPTTKFTRDSPGVYGVWSAPKGAAETVVRHVWIAIDTGGAAPPNFKIAETSQPFEDSEETRKAKAWSGTFHLTRPTKGWPVGKYRVELYFNERLVKTVHFTVE